MKTRYLCVLAVFGATTVFGGVESAYLSDEQVKNRDEVVGYGREYALGTARDSANHAADVAGATGAALTSAGVGFILAGNLPVGATLISMGSIEFAQMGANTGVSQQNGLQRAELVNGSPIGNGKTENTSAQNLDPRLDQYLQKQGIDPVQFKGNLFSGQFNDPKEVLSALHQNPADYSTTVLEKAQADAEKEFSKVASNLNETMGTLGGTFTSANSTDKSEGMTKNNPESRDNSEETRMKKAKGSTTLSNDSSTAVSAQFVPGLFGLPANAFSAEDQSLLFDAYLREQGIVPNHSGMNIFQMAQQGYRNFAKTRNLAKAGKNRVVKAD